MQISKINSQTTMTNNRQRTNNQQKVNSQPNFGMAVKKDVYDEVVKRVLQEPMSPKK